MAEAGSASVEVVRAPSLDPAPHGFLGRRGGAGTGPAADLQVGLGPEETNQAVIRNRQLAVDAACPGAELVTVRQVHSNRVVAVEAPFAGDQLPEADAMVTARPGLALAIVTADCAPVLLFDRKAGVIGAAHAGWRGAQGGIIQAIVAAMETLGATAKDIAAAIGPCIAQASYEVGEDLRQRFEPADERFFATAGTGKWRFDLAGYVAHRLEVCNVGSTEQMRLDTYALEDRFFSHRRATHRGEPDYGRQFSMIALPPPR